MPRSRQNTIEAPQELREGGNATNVCNPVDHELCAEFGRRIEVLARNGRWNAIRDAVSDFEQSQAKGGLTRESSVYELLDAIGESHWANALDNAGYLTVGSLVGVTEIELRGVYGLDRIGAATVIRKRDAVAQ